MKIIVVDDQQAVLQDHVKCIKDVKPDAEIFTFQNGQDALHFAQTQVIDVAFLDIEMPKMDGLSLGKQLKAQHSEINLIYVSEHERYISRAFREVRCNGFITKPISRQRVREELEHLRVPIFLFPEKRVKFQCFGPFEVYLDGEPFEFDLSKTKELLACLVHNRGMIYSNQELIHMLWEDSEDHLSYFKKIRRDLMLHLEENKVEDILWKRRGGLGINIHEVDCDFYDWVKRHDDEPYLGEYMTQYHWKEYAH